METLASTTTHCHTKVLIPTQRPTEFVDLTEKLQTLVADTGISYGFVNVQSLHTTTAIVVNEYEPGLLTDFATLLDTTAPRSVYYRHDEWRVRAATVPADERLNGHAHCRALLLGPSVCLNLIDGRLLLGRWQRIFFVELDGPREREISVLILGESQR